MLETLNFISQHTYFYYYLVLLFSLLVGSFLNVVIHRLPRILQYQWEQECRHYLNLPMAEAKIFNLSFPASHCPSCQQPIRAWHNIPLISYLWLKGKCSHCQRSISWRYPFIEALTAMASLLVAVHFGYSWQAAAGLVFTWIVICLIFIDVEFQLLPDQLTLALLWLGLLINTQHIFANPIDAIYGAIFGYSIFAITAFLFKLFTKREGMGFGDVKFLAALGAFLGWQFIPLIILLASFCGTIFALLLMTAKREWQSTPLPFGPWLALAGWIAMLYGQKLINLYIAMF